MHTMGDYYVSASLSPIQCCATVTCTQHNALNLDRSQAGKLMLVEIPMSPVRLDPSMILVSSFSFKSADLSVRLQHGHCPDSSMSSYTSVHHWHGCSDSLPLTRTNAFFLAVLAVDNPKGPCTQAFSNSDCRCMLLYLRL